MKQQQESVETVDVSSVLEAVKGSDETDTTKSSRPTSGSDTASSSSTLNDEAESIQYDDAVLTQLARQLEYYFSQANLDKDTYVETLRKLNDSYVPVSILQRFAKVQAFAPMETEDAIIKAATEFSDLLEVVSINTKTGKRVEDADASVATLLAVGTISREPLDNTRLQAVVPSSPKVPVQNTIIIREVDPRVTEEDVRALFDYEHCPPIQSLYLDVYNCWFVTLDTTSRDDMLYVMMQLRSQYLGDEPVKARMKSVVHQVDPTHAPGLPALTPVSSYTHLVNLPQTNRATTRTAEGNRRSARRIMPRIKTMVEVIKEERRTEDKTRVTIRMEITRKPNLNNRNPTCLPQVSLLWVTPTERSKLWWMASSQHQMQCLPILARLLQRCLHLHQRGSNRT